MIFFINNQLAVLKKDSSFEYVAENRLFSGADGYSLTITFPLKDCPQNLAIYGHINRADVAVKKVKFDCEIRDKGFSKFGTITITEISESEVKAQFLEGRSEQNFDSSFDDIYVNELELGKPEISEPSQISPVEAWNPASTEFKCVALPWVNNDSSSGLPHNFADFENGQYKWADTTYDLSWMPYLLYICKRICEAVGYSFDFSSWEEHPYHKFLIICNVLPGAWEILDFGRILPHWTVAEFFEKLELFLRGEFDIDHKAKHISFKYTDDILSNTPDILLDNVTDELSVSVSAEDQRCDYIQAKNIRYKDCNHGMWKYYSCDWFVRDNPTRIIEYDTMSQLMADNKWYAIWTHNGSTRNSHFCNILYARDIDRYFILRPIDRSLTHSSGNYNFYNYLCILQSVNAFGPRLAEQSEDAQDVEVEFVPAHIDFTETKYGFCVFVDGGSYNEDDNSSDVSDEGDAPFLKSIMQMRLEAGEEDKKPEYFGSVALAYWFGVSQNNGLLPYPTIDDLRISGDWNEYFFLPFSMRLNDSKKAYFEHAQEIDPTQKKTFSFLSDTIPNVRAIFNIRGKRYICEKITATFSAESGMSQLLKGIFWPLKV